MTASAFVVAVDGPAASGKGTIAKRIASELQLAHLDTGLLYRGVGWEAVSKGIELTDQHAVAALAAALDLSSLQGNPQLRGDEAAVAASKVSSLPAVRAALLEAQRKFAAHPPADKKGAVLDGRDIGTVICPDAPVKLYVTADVVVRAQRRLDELKSRGNASAADVNFDAVLSDMKARDDRDMNRATAPLKPADDAVILDTTQMSIEQAFAQARSIVETALAQQQQELQQQQPVAA